MRSPITEAEDESEPTRAMRVVMPALLDACTCAAAPSLICDESADACVNSAVADPESRIVVVSGADKDACADPVAANRIADVISAAAVAEVLADPESLIAAESRADTPTEIDTAAARDESDCIKAVAVVAVDTLAERRTWVDSVEADIADAARLAASLTPVERLAEAVTDEFCEADSRIKAVSADDDATETDAALDSLIPVDTVAAETEICDRFPERTIAVVSAAVGATLADETLESPAVAVVKPADEVTATDADACSRSCVVSADEAAAVELSDPLRLMPVVRAVVAVTAALRLDESLMPVLSAPDAVTDAVADAASRTCVDSEPDCVTAVLPEAASRICVLSAAELVTLTDAVASSAALDAAALFKSSSRDMDQRLRQYDLSGVCWGMGLLSMEGEATAATKSRKAEPTPPPFRTPAPISVALPPDCVPSTSRSHTTCVIPLFDCVPLP